MRPEVTYTSCATSSTGKTDDIITFAQFEDEGSLYETNNLLSETLDNTNSATVNW